MTNAEILELSDKELTGRIKEERLGLTKTKLGHAVSPLDNPKQIKDNRRLIARLLTEKRRRELVNVQ
ncbi:MAG: 50S ribosomal protein L29 [Bacteroidetes bacterium]|jgi:large subunit ribosomal protein L29|nr:50S ribosomal protein L29 [Bacteroidota bacterium]NDC29632.1 50S ribosomal protein L29 [Bacteroidota bacterium]